MSLRRHVLQVVALVTAVALVFGAFAGSAGAKKLNKSQKAKIRAELRKSVKKSPGVVKRRAFLRKAALVNFKLPVTIRLRNVCTPSSNPTGSSSPGGALLTTENCAAQGTALNQRAIPSARVNLGPSLGSRDIAIGGALSAVVEFSDTYDGGALGNVNLKILPGNKTLTTSAVPLLWNNDITNPNTRADSNFARASLRASGSIGATQSGLASWADQQEQGCGDWYSAGGTPNTTSGGGIFPAFNPALVALQNAGYKSLFYGSPYSFLAGSNNPLAPFYGLGTPGYSVYTATGQPNGEILPQYPGSDNAYNIRAGGVVGDNNWIGPNPFPFPSGSAPGTGAGLPSPNGTIGGSPVAYGGAPDTVLRTNALTLGIAQGGTSVNMSTGGASIPASDGGLPTAQGSQDVTLGYSGGQANLFGNIPGKNVGIDVTVNLETKINSIVRILDQDVYKSPSLVENEDYPAGIFNCRQIVTGAVQNYIPGVRLTGSLRIAPAITKDGKVRIAKATVSSDVNNPDRVALSACLFPAKPWQNYTATGTGASTDQTAAKLPVAGSIVAGGAAFPGGPRLDLTPNAHLGLNGNTALPLNDSQRWFTGSASGIAPTTTPCGTDGAAVGNGPGLADILRRSGLTGTVAGLPTVNDPAYAGVQYRGDQATVAGDITVNPIDVDVLLGDQPNVN